MSGYDYPPSPDPSGGQYPAAPPPGPGYAGPPAQPPPYPYPPQPQNSYPPQQNPYAQPQPYATPYPYAVPQTGNGLAVTALVLGIIGIVVSWIPFVSWIVGALAIIFGAVGMSTANKRGGIGKGMAVAGLVLGVITIAIGVVFWIWIFTTAHTICSTYGNC